MKTKRPSLITLTLGLALALLLGVFASLSRATPGNPNPNPDPNTHTAPLSSSISLTYDEVISAASVTSRTFAVHAMQTGLLTATHGAYSGTMVVTPTRPLHPGELVQATATTHTLNISGERPISPTVWQFRARASSSSGAFGAHPISPTIGAKDSYGVALGDVNGDGHLDAVVANYGDNAAEDVYFNDGTGRFVSPIISPTFGAGNSVALALGDVNNDSYLDAVVANWGQFNDVYLNNGIGGYSPHPISPTFGIKRLNWGQGIALGDINGDGYLDAIVANSSQGQYVYLNDGTGGFSPHPVKFTFGVGDGTSRNVSLGDMDSDGDLDALVAHDGAKQGIYLNDGAGIFSSHPISPTFGAGDSVSWDIALGDVNGDGRLDAVVANYEQAQDVYLNNGTGGYSPHPISPTFGTDHASFAVALGDLDGDGDLDAVVANDAQPQDVYLNDGTGRFVAQPLFPTFGSSQVPSRDLALGDIDGDGDLDALIANQNGYAQTAWLNRNLTDLSIAKSASSAFSAPGVPLTYTLTFTNHGPQVATYVIVEDSDVLPLGVWSVSSTVQITPNPGITYQWQIEHLAPGQEGVITISGQLVGELYNDDVLTNRASITTTDIDTNTLDNYAAISVTIDTEEPTRPTLLGPANNTFTRTNALTLAWSASPSADAMGYLLQLQAVEIDVGNVTTYSTGILLDGAYTWTVAAFDALAHTSPYTTPWSFSIDSTPPVPPDLFSPQDNSVINDTTPTLIWASSASTDTLGYLLNWNGLVSDVGDIHNFTLAPLDDGPYTWTVAAFDALGNVGDDADSNSFTLDTVAPQPPTLLSPANGALIHSSGLTLTWSASPSPDVAGYRLNWNGNAVNTHSATQYTFDLLYNGPYTWTVAAYDNASNSGAFTATWSFQVDIIAPPALRLIKSVDLGGLYEAPLDGIVTYTIVLSNSGEGPADDVTLLDELAPGLSFESWVEQGEAQLTPAVQWGPRDIAARSAHTISFAARVSTSAEFSGQSINNSAYFEAANAPSGSDSAPFYVAGSPRVLAVSPPNAAQDVSVEAAVVVTFSKLINASSLVVTGTLPNPGGLPAEWNSAGDVVTLSHNLFAYWTTYTVGLDAADLLGNQLSGAPYTWHFVTERYTVYLPLALKLSVLMNHSPPHSRR
jgi:uncharacterized repeat protein (TIGR01451 family)